MSTNKIFEGIKEYTPYIPNEEEIYSILSKAKVYSRNFSAISEEKLDDIAKSLAKSMRQQMADALFKVHTMLKACHDAGSTTTGLSLSGASWGNEASPTPEYIVKQWLENAASCMCHLAQAYGRGQANKIYDHLDFQYRSGVGGMLPVYIFAERYNKDKSDKSYPEDRKPMMVEITIEFRMNNSFNYNDFD